MATIEPAFRPKMYVVTRRDLLPGQQAVQSGHAAVEYCINRPDEAFKWNLESNVLVYLSVKDRDDLEDFFITVKDALGAIPFYEPDLNYAITAFASLAWTPADASLFEEHVLALRRTPILRRVK